MSESALERFFPSGGDADVGTDLKARGLHNRGNDNRIRVPGSSGVGNTAEGAVYENIAVSNQLGPRVNIGKDHDIA